MCKEMLETGALDLSKLFGVLPFLQFPSALTAFTSLQFCCTVSACFHKPAKTIKSHRSDRKDHEHVDQNYEHVFKPCALAGWLRLNLPS